MHVATVDREWRKVRPNEGTRQPRHHVFLDVEAYSTSQAGSVRQGFALAVGCLRVAEKGRHAHEQWREWADPVELWKDVDAFSVARKRVVLWCHNLSYDVRVSQALVRLPSMGWKLDTHNLSSRNVWLTWRRGDARLDMVDSASVFPAKLATVGKLFGLGKLPLPEDQEDTEGLLARCRRDVEILRRSVVEYLQWIEDDDLGNWQLTGAAQAWTVFRHKFLPKSLLIHGDAEALGAERRAMWTGRCEAYWHGELNRQVVHEWDFEMAYPRIAAATNVPVRLLGPMPDNFEWRNFLDSETTAVLAEVDIETRVPVVPTEDNGYVLWPVGRFKTTLWDPEIKAALDAGATVHIRRAWLYRKGPALKEWANWIMGEVRGAERGDRGWRYIVLKHWSRALIGRFAMTHAKWERAFELPTFDVRYVPGWDRDRKQSFEQLQIGHTVWENAGRVEWAQSMPMVTGYVQSVCRVWLWKMMGALPDQAVLYVDTDSVLVTDSQAAKMETIAKKNPEWGLRLKRSWDGFACWGPRQFRTGAMVRVAGIPKDAHRVDADRFAGVVWESMTGALHRGHPGHVIIRSRTWALSRIDRRRTGPPLGWTHPITLPREEVPP